VEPVGSDRGGVPRDEPTIGRHRLGRLLRQVQVTVEHRGSTHLQVADRLTVESDTAAVIGAQPGLDTVDRHPDEPGSTLPVVPGTDRDQRFGHPVPLDRSLPGQCAQLLEHRNRQCSAARHEQTGTCERRCCGRIGDDAGPYRGHREVQRPSGSRIAIRERLPGVDELRPDAQRSEHSQHEPVHVEQRKAVHEGVIGRPTPRVGQTIEARSDGAPRDDRSLRQPGRARGVHQQRRCTVGHVGPAGARAGGRHGDAGQRHLGPLGFADDERCAGVAQDVSRAPSALRRPAPAPPRCPIAARRRRRSPCRASACHDTATVPAPRTAMRACPRAPPARPTRSLPRRRTPHPPCLRTPRPTPATSSRAHRTQVVAIGR
jgi:hypothetical protein